VLPAQDPRHPPDLLQQADHALTAQAVPELGAAPEPLLTPNPEGMGQAGHEQHALLGFPVVVAPFHNPSALLVLAERGCNPRPALVGLSSSKRGQVRERGPQDGLGRAALGFGRAHAPLAGRATEARRA
jgi:hypothetical protein